MSKPNTPDDEVLRDLDARAAALERNTARPAAVGGAEGQAANQAYRLIAELVGGVLVGLGLGFAAQALHLVPAPAGLIGGVLLGFAVSIWMAKRTADRLTAQAAAENAGAQARPAAAPIAFDDEDD